MRPKLVPASAINQNTGDQKECGDYSWGACLDSYFQSKMSSVLMTDGLCHEDKIHREGRPCHVDFCGRSDPCRIPFVVHVILGFLGAEYSNWNEPAQDCVVNAFAATTKNTDGAGSFENYFEPGDVKLLMASPWYKETKRGMAPEEIGESRETTTKCTSSKCRARGRYSRLSRTTRRRPCRSR